MIHAVVDGVAFDGVEAGTVDHFDDLLFRHFYFAFGGTSRISGMITPGAVASAEINMLVSLIDLSDILDRTCLGCW